MFDDDEPMLTIAEPQQDALPLHSVDLLRELHERYPHRCPDRGENPEDVQRYAGKRELIDNLIYRTYGHDREKWPFGQ